MIKFEITFSRGKDNVIEECMLEIIDHNEEENRDYQMFTIDLNRQEVKELLDLMKEAYATLGKHKEKSSSKTTLKQKKKS
ncbi:MAG: hypothetical protein NWE99_01200 [Candidatus Bathyarchaeota archaeon]|nr:hypothetical protein [Candidatus Bathyarchaeota archaeon]